MDFSASRVTLTLVSFLPLLLGCSGVHEEGGGGGGAQVKGKTVFQRPVLSSVGPSVLAKQLADKLALVWQPSSNAALSTIYCY